MLGLILTALYYRQKIVFNDNCADIYSVLKRKRTVLYKDIDYFIIIPLSNQIQYILASREYGKICFIDQSMEGAAEAIPFLYEKGVKIADLGDLAENNMDISEYVPFLTKIQKNYLNSIYSVNRNIEDIEENADEYKLAKSRKRVKVVGWAVIAMLAASFIAKGKLTALLIAMVPLILWGMYIWFYPYMYFELPNNKKAAKYTLQMPFLGGGASIIISYMLFSFFSCDVWDYLLYLLLFTAILLIPLFLKSIKIRTKQRWTRTLSSVLAALMISSMMVFPVNYILTSNVESHDTIIVLKKDFTSGKYSDSYRIFASWNGKYESFEVSKSEYEEIELGDIMNVCIRKSAIGFKYWTVHK